MNEEKDELGKFIGDIESASNLKIIQDIVAKNMADNAKRHNKKKKIDDKINRPIQGNSPKTQKSEQYKEIEQIVEEKYKNIEEQYTNIEEKPFKINIDPNKETQLKDDIFTDEFIDAFKKMAYVNKSIRKFGPKTGIPKHIANYVAKITKGMTASSGYIGSIEKEAEKYNRKIKEEATMVEFGGRIPFKNLNTAGQVYSYFSERRSAVEQMEQGKIEKLENLMDEEINQISPGITGDEKDNKIKEIKERYQSSIGEVKTKHAPEISRLGRMMEKSQPVGMQFLPELKKEYDPLGRPIGVSGEAKDVTVQSMESELARAKQLVFNRAEKGEKPTLRRSDLGPMMSKILSTTENQRGSTLEQSRQEITEKTIKNTEQFIDANKNSTYQMEKFIKKFGEVDSAISKTTDSHGRFSKSMDEVGSSMVAITRMSSGIVSSVGALSRGDLAGIFSGTTTFMLGLKNIVGSTARIGSNIGGALGGGSVGGMIGGGAGILGGMAAAGIGAIAGIGAMGVSSAKSQLHEAGEMELAAYRIKMREGGGTSIPGMGSIFNMAGRALGAGMTLSEYQQLATQTTGMAMMSPWQSRSTVEGRTDMGITPLSEISRMATLIGRPVEELGGQVAMVSRAFGGNFQDIARSMNRVSGAGGMGGTLFTGELQNTFSQIAESIMTALGGIKRRDLQGTIENMITPMLGAGINPTQAGSVTNTLQSYVTGARFNPQTRLLLEGSLGVSQRAIERGIGSSGKTAVEELMHGIGLDKRSLDESARTGENLGIEKVKELTWEKDTEKAFETLTLYMMNLDTATANSIIETAKHVDAVAKSRQSLDAFEKSHGISSSQYIDALKKHNALVNESAKGLQDYKKEISNTEYLLNFKEKIIDVTGGIARGMVGLVDRGKVAEVMGNIEKAFEPIKGLAANAILPALKVVEGVVVKLGIGAEALNAKLHGIDPTKFTEQLTSGSLFKEYGSTIGKTISKGLSDIIADAGLSLIDTIKDAFARKYPTAAGILGIEKKLTPEEIKQEYKIETPEDLKREKEQNLKHRVAAYKSLSMFNGKDVSEMTNEEMTETIGKYENKEKNISGSGIAVLLQKTDPEIIPKIFPKYLNESARADGKTTLLPMTRRTLTNQAKKNLEELIISLEKKGENLSKLQEEDFNKVQEKDFNKVQKLPPKEKSTNTLNNKHGSISDMSSNSIVSNFGVGTSMSLLPGLLDASNGFQRLNQNSIIPNFGTGSSMSFPLGLLEASNGSQRLNQNQNGSILSFIQQSTSTQEPKGVVALNETHTKENDTKFTFELNIDGKRIVQQPMTGVSGTSFSTNYTYTTG